MLLEIEPGLPTSHAPEMEYFRNKSIKFKDLKDYRNVFLFPFANLEDLSWNNGIQFLSLLHHRAHNFPSEFAQFDQDTLRFGIDSGGIRSLEAPNCSMLGFGGRDTYGKVVRWEEPIGDARDAPDAFELESVWGEAMPLADGIPVLEAQRKLISLLLRVVSGILYDQDLGTLPSPLPAMLPPEIPLVGSSFEYLSVARSNTLRAYLEPSGYSFAQLEDIANSRYDLAVNHLIDLRTDPTYLAEQLNDYAVHRIEHLNAGGAPDAMIHNRASRFLVGDTYSDIIFWHVMKELLAEASEIQANLSLPIHRGTRLPEEYERTIQVLRPLVNSLVHKSNVRFSTTMASSPRLRQYCTVTFEDQTLGRNQLSYEPDPTDSVAVTFALLLDPDLKDLCEISRIYDELDRLLDSNEQKRITPLFGKALSEMGTYYQVLKILDSHRPKVRVFDHDEQSMYAMNKCWTRWWPVMEGFNKTDRVEMNIGHIAFPSTKYVYPKGPKSLEWAGRCEAVDRAFDAFWEAADRKVLERYGAKVVNITQALLPPRQKINWRSLVVRKPVNRLSPSPSALLPFGGADQKSPTEANVASIPAKVKKKTRGTTTAYPEQHSPELASNGSDNKQNITTIPVTARILKVFAALFRMTDDEQIHTQAGTIAWSEILHAFAFLGFKILKGRGSAWQFRHPDGRSVNMHGPHPEPNLSFWEVRRFGRRLSRRFNWTGDSFALSAA
ncbi:hypothetical protein BD410DRAFT_189208 [Rickenella mellea]|uniref:Uncharacterized protein n=1 Tax=Rickenella mellea TaxID=50990 RepID=A0A4Y7Q859_9AGAM|nr:hypothetical protein BD410DRAFT_189208 [Rickenella mellea]